MNANELTRKRDSGATREAIADAARLVFSQSGYDAAGLREIAGMAGVNVALISRYFGSKEGLFKQAVLPTLHIDGLLEGGIDEFADRIIAVKQQASTTKVYDPALVIIRALQSPVAGPLVRKALQEQVVKPLAKLLPGSNTEKRAEMIGSVLLGYDMYHRGSEYPGGSAASQKLLRDTLNFLIAT